MAVCVEDNSRSQGLYCQLGVKIFWLSCSSCHSIILGLYVSGPEDSPVPVGLKVWKTIPFVEDILVSGTEAIKLIG
jgi:hypothetical protein